MKITLLCVLASLSSLLCFSQSDKAARVEGQNSFFAEGGGAGIAFSANIDRRFKPSNFGFGGRVGLGFVTAYNDYFDQTSNTYYWGNQQSAITIPVQLNYVFGKGSSPHTFEVGGGLTYVSKKLSIMNYYDDDRTQLFGTFAFMYRRQPKHGGFSWRAGFTPLIGRGLIQPFGGVSVGYNF